MKRWEPVRGESKRKAWRLPATLQEKHNHFAASRSVSPTQKFHANDSSLRIPRKQPAAAHWASARSCDILLLVPARVPHARFPRGEDQKLIQIVDRALADAAAKSGEWLACRPGCTQCCIGAFAINQLDAHRLRQGLEELYDRDPQRAHSVRRRALEAVKRLAADFPGDPATGILDENEDAARRFDDFANDEPCPALDPQTGLCELYETRPMTCRVFGPPVRSEDGLGVCELCFQGASDSEIATCEMVPDPGDRESRLLKKFEKSAGVQGNTIIAFCLAS